MVPYDEMITVADAREALNTLLSLEKEVQITDDLKAKDLLETAYLELAQRARCFPLNTYRLRDAFFDFSEEAPDKADYDFRLSMKAKFEKLAPSKEDWDHKKSIPAKEALKDETYLLGDLVDMFTRRCPALTYATTEYLSTPTGTLPRNYDRLMGPIGQSCFSPLSPNGQPMIDYFVTNGGLRDNNGNGAEDKKTVRQGHAYFLVVELGNTVMHAPLVIRDKETYVSIPLSDQTLCLLRDGLSVSKACDAILDLRHLSTVANDPDLPFSPVFYEPENAEVFRNSLDKEVRHAVDLYLDVAAGRNIALRGRLEDAIFEGLSEAEAHQGSLKCAKLLTKKTRAVLAQYNTRPTIFKEATR